jgi:hypothetical protein
MKPSSKFVFIVVFILYAAYNVFWLIGTTFSFGKNDTMQELIYLLLTFVADLPVMWWVRKDLMTGGIGFLILLIAGVWSAASLSMVSGFSILLWYVPKVAMLMTAISTGRPSKHA